MGGLRLGEDHFDPLQSLLLVVELSPDHIVEMLAVLPRLVPQVVQHLFGAEIFPGDLLGVHKSLSHRQKLVLGHFDHLGQFSFFFVEASVLLLLFSQLRGGIKQELEILRIASVFEEVDLGEQLLFLLLQLGDFFLQLSWIHALLTQCLCI